MPPLLADVVAFGVGVAVGLLVAFGIIFRDGQRGARAILAAREQLELELANLRALCEYERARATEEERKRLEQFAMIEGILKERDGWKDELFRCGRGYSVGQAMMMGEIQRLALIAKRPVRKEVLAVEEKFKAEFGAEGMAEIEGRIGGGKSPPAAESVAKVDPNA